MPKKECRYNKKHKFNTEEKQLEHESKCEDKEKRTDLKVCPFSNKHILPILQFNAHIQKCKYKPKDFGKPTQNNDKNNNANNEFNTDNLGDFGGENETKNEEEIVAKPEKHNFNFDFKDNNGDVFDEVDFIFKQCYI